MISHIPMRVVDDAIADMSAEPDREVIGFFCMDAGYNMQWHRAENIAADTSNSSEIDATWLAQKIINEELVPVAMIHSHPSGINEPSDGDYIMFPTMYVNVAYIWVKNRPDVLTQYTAIRELHVVAKSEVFLHVYA